MADSPKNNDTPTFSPDPVGRDKIVGTDEEIAEIERQMNTPPGQEPGPAPAPAPKAAPATAPAEDAVDVDGEMVPLGDLKNQFRRRKANDRRAQEIADERRQFEAQLKGVETRLSQRLDDLGVRIPEPPPPPEPEIEIPDLGEMPDYTTVDGAEQLGSWMKESFKKVALATQKATIEALRKEPAKPASAPGPEPAAASAEPDLDVDPSLETVVAYNRRLSGNFLEVKNLTDLGISREEATRVLDDVGKGRVEVEATGETDARSGLKLLTLNDLNRLVKGTNGRAAPATATPPSREGNPVSQAITDARRASETASSAGGAPQAQTQHQATLKRVSDDPSIIKDLPAQECLDLLRQGFDMGLFEGKMGHGQ